MANILKLNKISKVADKNLPGHTLLDECERPEGIILRSFNMHEYPLTESLLCVARAGAGTNNIPIDKCTEKGIVVFNTPGANANAVKELVIFGMLLCGRKLYKGIAWANGLSGDDIGKQVEDGKKAFVGGEIMGKTLGVIGMGAIGTKVAEAAIHLGMNVIGCDPHYTDKRGTIDSHIELTDDREYIYKNCDFITVHTPLTDSTRGMINNDTLKLMKDGVNILNYARGELVDTAAIVAAVKSGKVNRYACDFPSAALIGVDNIVCTPHLGASTPEAEDNCAEMAAKQTADYLENGNIVNSVNFPKLVKPRTAKTRVCLLTVGEDAKALLAKAGFENIEGAKKGNNGYAVADCDKLPCGCEESLRAASGVVRVRIIK